MSIAQVWLDQAAALIATGQRKILGIAAPPGAGKSTFAQALQAHFPNESLVLPMDGFHLANSELERLGRAQRKGAPDTFDAAGYVNLLARIRGQALTAKQSPDTAHTIYAPDFRREFSEGIAGAIAVEPHIKLVITEGNYLLLQEGAWRNVRAQLDVAWYLSVDDTVRNARLAGRHMRYGRTQEQALAWIAQTDEPNAVRIAASRHLADAQVLWDEL